MPRTGEGASAGDSPVVATWYSSAGSSPETCETRLTATSLTEQWGPDPLAFPWVVDVVDIMDNRQRAYDLPMLLRISSYSSRKFWAAAGTRWSFTKNCDVDGSPRCHRLLDACARPVAIGCAGTPTAAKTVALARFRTRQPAYLSLGRSPSALPDLAIANESLRQVERTSSRTFRNSLNIRIGTLDKDQ